MDIIMTHPPLSAVHNLKFRGMHGYNVLLFSVGNPMDTMDLSTSVISHSKA